MDGGSKRSDCSAGLKPGVPGVLGPCAISFLKDEAVCGLDGMRLRPPEFSLFKGPGRGGPPAPDPAPSCDMAACGMFCSPKIVFVNLDDLLFSAATDLTTIAAKCCLRRAAPRAPKPRCAFSRIYLLLSSRDRGRRSSDSDKIVFMKELTNNRVVDVWPW